MSSFAIYRLPNSSICHMVSQHDSLACRIDNMREASNGFIIHPFEVSVDYPILFIKADRVADIDASAGISSLLKMQINSLCADNKAHNTLTTTRQQYDSGFSKLHIMLQKGLLDKAVLARCLVLDAGAAMQPAEMLEYTLLHYPSAYVAMFSTPQSGTWLVASPEILLECSGNKCTTIALAGTARVEQYLKLPEWDCKNRHEQQIVSDYIVRKLEALGIEVDTSGPHTVEAAHLVHIRTDFGFNINNADQIGQVVEALHPTPAVCGLPEDAALVALKDAECLSRAYFSGFSGPIDLAGETHLFVTLRCMAIDSGKCTLYAGSGIMKQSTAEDEWQETANKMMTMQNVLTHAMHSNQ